MIMDQTYTSEIVCFADQVTGSEFNVEFSFN